MKSLPVKTDSNWNTWELKNGCYWLIPRVQNRTKEELEKLIKEEIKNMFYELWLACEQLWGEKLIL